MVRTLTNLKDTIKQQKEEIQRLQKEIKILNQQLEEEEEAKDMYMQICNSCPKCSWKV